MIININKWKHWGMIKHTPIMIIPSSLFKRMNIILLNLHLQIACTEVLLYFYTAMCTLHIILLLARFFY